MKIQNNLLDFDEKTFNQLEASLKQDVDNFSKNGDIILGVAVKEHLKKNIPFLDKILSLDKQDVLYVRTLELVKGVLNYSLFKERGQPSLIKSFSSEGNVKPSLDFYDGLRDAGGQYKLKYGLFDEK